MIAPWLAAVAAAAPGAVDGSADPPADPTVEALPLPEPNPRVRRPVSRFETSGFRAVTTVGAPRASTRVAFVQDFDGPSIGELTLRGQAGWRHFGLSVETVVTAGVSPRWAGAGFGNTVLDLRWILGRGSTHALGLRGTLATGMRDGAHGAVAWWGTVPQATLPTNGVAVAYEGATERVVWHLHAGLRWGEYYRLGGDMLDLGVLVATVQPITSAVSIVGEGELSAAQSPGHLRALARVGLGNSWTVDAGINLPIPAMISDPTLQVIARVEWRP